MYYLSMLVLVWAFREQVLRTNVKRHLVISRLMLRRFERLPSPAVFTLLPAEGDCLHSTGQDMVSGSVHKVLVAWQTNKKKSVTQLILWTYNSWGANSTPVLLSLLQRLYFMVEEGGLSTTDNSFWIFSNSSCLYLETRLCTSMVRRASCICSFLSSGYLFKS